MEIFRQRLIETMSTRGIRATELARRTDLSKARISQYVNGKYVPKADAVCRIAEVLEVSPLWLMGQTDNDSPIVESAATPEHASVACPKNMVPLHLCRYPILGEIACGKPILAEEDRDGNYVTAAETTADFVLTARGDSMINARIMEGDQVFIQQTDMVNNGDIAAVSIDDEAVLKRVYYYPDEEKLVLASENRRYEPMVFRGEELAHIHILGRAVAVQAKVR